MLLARSSTNNKKILSRLSARDDELLSTSKITIFLAKPLLKIHEPQPQKAFL